MAFLVFEGLDGSGKSTLIKGLAEELQAQEVPYLLTREPGGTDLGDEIRELLIRVNHESPVPRTEALLYQASRAQLVDTVITPAIKENKWVLCDRYTASSRAFQSGGRELKSAQIDWLSEFATDGLKPDLWVLLDLPLEESIKRVGQRGQVKDRMEQEKRDFHQKVRDSYLEQSGQSDSWLVLDAMLPPEELCRLLIEKLKEKNWLQ